MLSRISDWRMFGHGSLPLSNPYFYNQLLRALPADVQQRLIPDLEFIELPFGRILHAAGEPITQVYFPVSTIVSLAIHSGSTAASKISVVGNEGLVGTSLFMGGNMASLEASVAHKGHAYQLSAQRLLAEFNQHGECMSMLLRYTQSLITQISLTAICSRHHSIEQQFYRWLLMCLDRLPSNRIAMTQHVIAKILGVRRESITDVAGKLQKMDVIAYSRGYITVKKPEVLAAMCCECYGVVREEALRLQPYLSIVQHQGGG